MTATRGVENLAVAVLVCLVAGVPLSAAGEPCPDPCTVCWKQPVSGSWDLDSSWNSGRVSIPEDHVCINRNGVYTVSLDIDATVAGLTVGGEEGTAELEVVEATLTLTGDAQVLATGALTVVNGAVETAIGVTLSNDAETVVEGAATIGGSLTNGAHGVLRVRATADRGDAVLQVDNFLTNGGLIRLENADAVPREAAIVVHGGALVENQTGAEIVADGSGGGARRIIGGLSNSGQVLVSGGALTVEGSEFVNQPKGSIDVLLGELDVVYDPAASLAKASPQFANSGSVALSSGTRVRIRGSGSSRMGEGAPVAKALVSFANLGSISTEIDSEFIVIDLSFTNHANGVIAGEGTFDFREATAAANEGTVQPGLSVGTLQVLGDLDQGPGGRLDIEIGGRFAGGSFDQLLVDGALDLGGTLQARLIRGFAPETGDRFRFLRYDSLSGSFDTLDLPDLSRDLDWGLITTAQMMELEVVCDGPDLEVRAAADKDPVSLGYPLLYTVVVANPSARGATGVTLRDALPATLVFAPELSSPGCRQIGGDVECAVGAVGASGLATVTVAAEPVTEGMVTNPFYAGHIECVSDPQGYSKTVTVRVTSAQPCDATDDGDVATDDVAAAVAHVFGVVAPGNPDCAVGDGVNAADLAKLVLEAAQP